MGYLCIPRYGATQFTTNNRNNSIIIHSNLGMQVFFSGRSGTVLGFGRWETAMVAGGAAVIAHHVHPLLRILWRLRLDLWWASHNISTVIQLLLLLFL